MFEIVKARYGTCDDKSIDVIDTIKRILEKGCNSLYVCNDLFGVDPHPNNPKYLMVQWADGFRMVYGENTQVVIEHVWDSGGKREVPFCPIRTRNLIYHVAPLTSGRDIWKWNIQLLRKLGDSILNGRRVVGIVTGVGMDDVQAVLDEFGDFKIDQLLIGKNTSSGELETFGPALRHVYSMRGDECFYYAHTKGVRWKGHHWELGAREWTECMYRCLFERGDIVDAKLLRYPVVGAFKSSKRSNMWDLVSPGVYVHNSAYGWMFNGSFFVCRNDGLFNNPHWDMTGGDKYWIERFPSFFFRDDEAGTIYDEMNSTYEGLGELASCCRYYLIKNWTKTDWRSILGR